MSKEGQFVTQSHLTNAEDEKLLTGIRPCYEYFNTWIGSGEEKVLHIWNLSRIKVSQVSDY